VFLRITQKRSIMKLGHFLQPQFLKRTRQRGQAIVEFVLLLAVMAGVTMLFVSFMNRSIVRYWEYSANLIINDKPNQKTISIFD
jgi:hypothetical protein